MKQSSRNVMLLPSRHKDKRTAAVRIPGYIFRCVPAFLCAYGFTRFVLHSAGIVLPDGLLISACLLICTLFAVMELGDRLFFCGTAIFAAVAVYVTAVNGGPKNTVLGIGTAFYNACLKRLDSLGYPDMDSITADFKSITDGTVSEYGMLCVGGVFFAFLICSTVMLLTVRKAHILPIAVTLSFILVFVFYFGMGDDTVSFCVALCGFCGCAALARYDAVFLKRRSIAGALGADTNMKSAEKEIDDVYDINSAMGGYYGICAAFLAFLVVLIPAGTDKSMDDIPAISVPLTALEDRILSSVRGYSSYEDGIAYGDPHATAERTAQAEQRSYSGKTVIRLETDTDTPVYLRSWVGAVYKNDAWSIVSQAETEEYRNYFGNGFSPELLTAELLNAVFTVSELPVSVHGYTATDVHISTASSDNSILLLPSYTDPRSGLKKHGTDEPLSAAYYNYYEGIFVSGSKFAPRKYSVSAFIPDAPTQDTVTALSEIVEYYNRQHAIIAPMRKLIAKGGTDEDIAALYGELNNSSDESRDGYTLAYLYAYSMDEEERTRINALMDNISMYDDYVKSYYLEMCEGSEQIVQLAHTITRGIQKNSSDITDEYLKQHETVMAVTEYLKENTSYTLSPKKPSEDRQYVNAADTFLFDTREGYCVQYATSAAMLLRALGIPTRYAEGYIADSFAENTSGASDAEFCAELADRNAHAWIEVYYRGFGWIKYEVTAPYSADAYASEHTPSVPSVSDTPATAPSAEAPSPTETAAQAPSTDTQPSTPASVQPTEAQSSASAEDTAKDTASASDISRPSVGDVISVIAVCAVIFAVAAAAISAVILIHRGRTNEKKRHELIRLACRAELSDEQAFDTASQMNDGIMKMLKHLHLIPMPGEFAHSFAARADKTLGTGFPVSLLTVTDAVQRTEFGRTVSPNDLRLIADYYDALYRFVTEKNGKISTFYAKYFLRFY